MSLFQGSPITNSKEGEKGNNDGNNGGAMTRSPPRSPYPYYFPTPPTSFFHEFQSHFQFMNSVSPSGNPSIKPRMAAKRLIVQIGCEEKGNNTKQFPKILKAINDTELTVEDLLHDLLWKDVGVNELRDMLDGQKGIITGTNTVASLTLSLGPNRSIELLVFKRKKGLIFKKSIDKEDSNDKKRNRKDSNPNFVLKMKLVTSESGIVLCPRDSIYNLIENAEEVILRPGAGGSWEYPELPDSTANAIAITPPPEAIANVPAEKEIAESPPASPPAKRRKIQKEPVESPKKKVTTPSKKRSISEQEEKKKAKAKTDKNSGGSGNDHIGSKQVGSPKPKENAKTKVNGKANDNLKTKTNGKANDNLKTKVHGKANDNAKTKANGKANDNLKTKVNGKANDNAKTKANGKVKDNSKTKANGKANDDSQTKVNGKANDSIKRRKNTADDNSCRGDDGADKQKTGSSKNTINPRTQPKPKLDPKANEIQKPKVNPKATQKPKINSKENETQKPEDIEKSTEKMKNREDSNKNNSDGKNVSSCDDDKKVGQKKTRDLSQKSKANAANNETNPKKENRSCVPGFTDQDVLLYSGGSFRNHAGNLNFNDYVASKLEDYRNAVNRKAIADEVMSKFTFHQKKKGMDSWILCSPRSKVVQSKVRRDFKKQTEEKHIVSKRVVKKIKIAEQHAGDKNQVTSEDSPSRKSNEESDKGDNTPERSEGGSLSDETPQVEEKKDVGERKTNQTKSKTERLPDQSSDRKESDANQSDESSSSSSRSSSSSSVSSKNSKRSRSSNSGDVDNDENYSTAGKEKGSKYLENSQKKGVGNIKTNQKNQFITTSSVVTNMQVVTNSQEDGGDSEDKTGDDSSSSSSDVSTTSSSSVSSSSDEDSSSDGSDCSPDGDKSESISTQKSLIAQDSLAKLSPSKSSTQKQQQSAKRSKRRKPLLDPSKPLVF